MGKIDVWRKCWTFSLVVFMERPLQRNLFSYPPVRSPFRSCNPYNAYPGVLWCSGFLPRCGFGTGSNAYSATGAWPCPLLLKKGIVFISTTSMWCSLQTMVPNQGILTVPSFVMPKPVGWLSFIFGRVEADFEPFRSSYYESKTYPLKIHPSQHSLFRLIWTRKRQGWTEPVTFLYFWR